jgi:CRP-like cAMP-binding protein
MLTVEKVLFLRRIDLFADIPARELGRIARIAREVSFPAGATVFRAGEYGDSLFIVVSGGAAVLREGKVIGALNEGEYFGEVALLTGETRSATIKASVDCLLLRIGQVEFHQILADDFAAVLSVIRTLCRRLRPADPTG